MVTSGRNRFDSVARAIYRNLPSHGQVVFTSLLAAYVIYLYQYPDHALRVHADFAETVGKFMAGSMKIAMAQNYAMDEDGNVNLITYAIYLKRFNVAPDAIQALVAAQGALQR